MDEITSSEVVRWTNGTPLHIKNVLRFSSVATDSRSIRPHALFIALQGERFDGHDFLDDAFARGAKAALVARKPSKHFPCIVVSDTLKGLGALAGGYRKRFSCPIIGIAGSDGKTTTKEMTAAILETSYKIAATEGNLNNEIGLPISLFHLNASSDVGIFEMGMNAPGELSRLGHILQPTIGILTGIGYSHIGMLKNRRNLAEAKCEIFASIQRNGMAAASADTPFSRLIIQKSPVPVTFYGFSQKADFRGEIVQWTQEGFLLTVPSLHESFPINVWNGALAYPALAAVWMGNQLGVAKEAIKEVLANFRPLRGRGMVIQAEGIEVFDESYNANPASMQNALRYFAMIHASRKIAVLGAMAELGKRSGYYHRKIGAFAAGLPLDMVLTCGSDALHIATALGKKGRHFSNTEELTRWLMANIRKGDAVLVKGSHVNKLEQVVTALTGTTETSHAV